MLYRRENFFTLKRLEIVEKNVKEAQIHEEPEKVLSLVMAVAMMVSICVVGASAVNYDDFSDKGEITKTEAVETLVNLDILDGYDGGATQAPPRTSPALRWPPSFAACWPAATPDRRRHQGKSPPTPTSTVTGRSPTLSTAPAWASSPVRLPPPMILTPT